MTKRYARIASDQVRQAVSGLDAFLERESGNVSHPFATGSLQFGAKAL